MADIYSTDLPVKATEIRNESDAGENTATRVGDMFLSIIDYISQNEEDWLRDTGGTGQGQLQLPVGLTGLLGSLSTVNDLPSGQNKILVWKNADANPNGWGYLATPTGGTGTGSGDVTWSALTGQSSGYKIHSSYLTDALSDYLTNAKLTNTGANASKYTWWGRYLTSSTSNGVTNYKVEGPLSGGITYIQFSNGIRIESVAAESGGSPALKVYNTDGNATTDSADFYATGGVSALGNSSSGGGGGDTPTPTPGGLGTILTHIKNNSDSDPIPNIVPEGATVRWDGNGWTVDKTTWEDLGAVAPGFTANNINYLLKCSTSNGGLSYSYEWIPISSSSGNVTKLSNVGDVAAYNPSADGILAYVNEASAQEKWQYKRFLINPSQDVTYDGSPVSLTSIILGDTKYNVPTYSAATTQAAGLLSAADKTKLDGIASGANNYSHPTGFTVKNTSNFYKYTVNTNGHVTAGDALSGSDLKSLLNGQTGVGISISGNAATAGTADKAKSVVDSDGYGLTKYAWGQKYLNNGEFLEPTDSITVTIPNSRSQDDGNNHKGIIIKRGSQSTNFYFDAVSTTNSVIRMVGDNIIDYAKGASNPGLTIGYGSRPTISTILSGKDVSLQVYDPASITEQNSNPAKDVIKLTTGFQTYLPQATQASSGLRIGDAILYWDNSNGNNSLALVKSDGTACNFYATGGVSALGLSNGTSSIDAMTFGVVDITSSLKIKLGNTNNKATIYTNTGTGLIIDNPYGGIFINDSATYINDAAGDTYFGGDENTDGGNIYICLASQGYEYYRLDVDKLQRDGYLTLD